MPSTSCWMINWGKVVTVLDISSYHFCMSLLIVNWSLINNLVLLSWQLPLSYYLYLYKCLGWNRVVWGFLWCGLDAGVGLFLHPNSEIPISSHILETFSYYKVSGLCCISSLWAVEATDCYQNSSLNLFKENGCPFLLCAPMCCQSQRGPGISSDLVIESEVRTVTWWSDRTWAMVRHVV